MLIDWMGYGYAILVLSGGIIGYVKAGSVASLVAGLLFGGFAMLGAYQMSHNPKKVWVFLGALAVVMGIRFFNSGKFMPAGLIAGASILMLCKIGLTVLHKSKEP